MPHDKSGETSYRRLFHTNGYKKRNLPFSIFLELVKMNCYYCGSPPKLVNPRGSVYKEFNNQGVHISYQYWEDSWVLFNGIDKKEHKEDYSDVSNLVPCCKICNFLKQRMDHDQFLDHIHKIANQHPIQSKTK